MFGGVEIVWLAGRDVLGGNWLDGSGLVRRRLDVWVITAADVHVRNVARSAAQGASLNNHISTGYVEDR